MDDIIVIDNFFIKYLQRELFNLIVNNENSCWKYIKKADGVPYKECQEKDNLITEYDQFVRRFDSKDETYWHNIVQQHIKKHFDITIERFLRSRLLFSIPRININKESYGVPHVDFVEPHHTLIYYVNDNPCNTIFFKEFYDGKWSCDKKTIEKKVQPKQGRAVLFNGHRYHTVETYNESNRFLLSVNFKVL